MLRFTADTSAPTDAPSANTFYHTITSGGHFVYNTQSYQMLQPTTGGGSVINATLSGSIYYVIAQDNGFTINATSPGGVGSIYLPNPATLPAGWKVNLINVGATNNIGLYDYAGDLYCSIEPGYSISPYTYMNTSGSIVFPPTALSWTSGPPAAPAPF